MNSLRRIVPALIACSSLSPVAAAAGAPNVQLQFSGVALVNTRDGVVRKPLSSVVLHTGDEVRFTIVALNRGDEPALAFSPTGPVQPRFAFVAGTASAAGASVKYSVDGRTFSASPTVTVATANGPQSRPADPATYRAVRWLLAKPLAPHEKATFSYEVRVR